MEPGYRLRLYLLTALVLVGFGALLDRLHEFQIERRNEFLNMVPGNRTVTVREPGIRGEITDRNGIVLARNLRKYEVSFNLEEIREAYLAQHESDPTIERAHQRGRLGPRKRRRRTSSPSSTTAWTHRPPRRNSASPRTTTPAPCAPITSPTADSSPSATGRI